MKVNEVYVVKMIKLERPHDAFHFEWVCSNFESLANFLDDLKGNYCIEYNGYHKWALKKELDESGRALIPFNQTEESLQYDKVKDKDILHIAVRELY